jgi:tRNA threonylcarbamoyladenosine biosynthesis protein TsaE
LQLELKSPEDTHELGKKLASLVDELLFVTLIGPLGAGKTTFAQGAAEALNVEGVVNSPTFTMINEYTSGRLPLYHLDLYRLNDTGTAGGAQQNAHWPALEAELDEIQAAPGLILVEWAEYFQPYIDRVEHVRVELNYSTLAPTSKSAPEGHGEIGRTALISATGDRTSRIVEKLTNIYFS